MASDSTISGCKLYISSGWSVVHGASAGVLISALMCCVNKLTTSDLFATANTALVVSIPATVH